MTRRTTLERRPTQTARIVGLLRERRGQWVPLTDILALTISQYSARVYQARHEWGLNIENRVEIVNGQKHSFFRLVEDPKSASAPAAKQSAAQPVLTAAEQRTIQNLQPSLPLESLPQRWVDPEEQGGR